MEEEAQTWQWDPKYKVYQCNHCPFTSMYYDAIMRHGRTHFKKEQFKLSDFIDQQIEAGRL